MFSVKTNLYYHRHLVLHFITCQVQKNTTWHQLEQNVITVGKTEFRLRLRDSVFCLHSQFIFGPVAGKVPITLQRQVPEVFVPSLHSLFSGRTKLLSATTASLCCSQPLFLLYSSFPKFPKASLLGQISPHWFLKCLLPPPPPVFNIPYFPPVALFLSVPKAEAAVAPAAAAALAAHLSYTHACCVLAY